MTFFQYFRHLNNKNLIHTYADLNLEATKQNVCLLKKIKRANYFSSCYSLPSGTAVAIWLILCGISSSIASQE